MAAQLIEAQQEELLQAMVTAAKLGHHPFENMRDLFVAQRHHAGDDTHHARFIDLVEGTEQYARRIRANDDIRSANDHLKILSRRALVRRAKHRSTTALSRLRHLVDADRARLQRLNLDQRAQERERGLSAFVQVDAIDV